MGKVEGIFNYFYEHPSLFIFLLSILFIIIFYWIGYIKGKNKAHLNTLKKLSEMQLEIQELKHTLMNTKRELKERESELENLKRKYEPSFTQKVIRKIKGESDEE
ncbi:hypothetical protein NLC29_03215 [Candidatus Aminicenantes bacterium AH-873-B07]|jgi:Tfp pilus assembly protein PilO|nr:hypothetical protein [Candidatus Aminicenantes bacterium AH-873-B07]